jgi:hypothetical protein
MLACSQCRGSTLWLNLLRPQGVALVEVLESNAKVDEAFPSVIKLTEGRP